MDALKVDNSNLHSNTSYLLLPGFLSLKIKSYPIPGVSASPIIGYDPHGKQYKVPDNTFELDDLDIDFTLDESLQNYLKLRKWFFDSLKDPMANLRDASIVFADNDNIVNTVGTLSDVFPTRVSQIIIDHTNQEAAEYSFTITLAVNSVDF